ncbi:MAG: T9SS type A sorting domain-containing protein [Chitinophagales bacterium]|nr:T9SS type A sorting domain-containing protein [Chitinophagales bacterium]
MYDDSISSVNIDVYSISGILVESFTNIELENTQINFNLSNLSSGEYLINLTGEQFQSSRLITIQK